MNVASFVTTAALRDFSRGFKNLLRAVPLQLSNTGQDSLTSAQSVDCQTSPIVYFLIVRDAHGSPRSARFENQGRTRKSAAVCA
jgi:hypothetical protein